MCDIIVALPHVTSTRSTLFGKNSDRQRNEAQNIEIHASRVGYDGKPLHCTYIAIPDAPRTYATVLSRPYWIWGAEMGANERGVAIGNEGLNARIPPSKSPALTGMDLVRLGLERGGSAREALEVITELLDSHGQGGDCGQFVPNYYDNSFVIVDADEGYLLETVGREWAFSRICDYRAVSNCYSISVPEGVSAGLEALVSNLDPTAAAAPLDTALLADQATQHLGAAAERKGMAGSFLSHRKGHLDVGTFKAALRLHPEEPTWNVHSTARYGVCMHARNEERGGQTTASMVSELAADRSIHWLTGTASPCISLFKPILLHVPVPASYRRAGVAFDPASWWWRHEILHRAALASDFAPFLAGIAEERDAIEASFRSRVTEVVRNGAVDEQRIVVEQCWDEAELIESRWRTRRLAPRLRGLDEHSASWRKADMQVGLPSKTQC
jgi:nucleotide-binding universal stress UspA family protein